VGDGVTESIFGGNYLGDGSQIQLYAEDGSHRTYRVEPDIDDNGGWLGISRNEFGALGFTVDGNRLGTESTWVSINGQNSSMVFDTDATGDGSVALPVSSVSATEMLNEVGVASAKDRETAAYNLTTSLSTITARTINVPTDGYVMVVANYEIDLNHQAGVSEFSTIGVSDTAGLLGNNQDQSFYIPAGAAAGLYLAPCSASGVFEVEAGLNTFYLNGFKNNSTSDFQVWDVQLNVVFIPTAYGAIEPTVAEPGMPEQDFESTAGGPALSSGDIAAERAESEAFVQRKMADELSAMQARIDELQRQLETLNTAAATGR
jgi:hypothetical protein